MKTRRQRIAAQCITAVVFLLAVVAVPSAQSTGTLAPAALQTFLDDSGAPCASCQLFTYTTGTTTLATVYQDMALSVPHQNPIVLNAAGRPPAAIYLTAATFKFVLKSAAGATIWTVDGIGAVPGTTIATSFNSVCDGRLSLTTGTPVTTSDVTAATTIRFEPYNGNRCALYDGSQWALSSFSELSIALGTDTANTNYDVFMFLSSGSPTIERVAWTNDTTRAVSLVSQDGVLVKSSDTKRRYVGTYRTTGSAGQTEDSAAKRLVWNYKNRVPRALRVTEATDSWTYTLNTFRQANGSTANQVAVVIGVAEVPVSLRLVAMAANSAGNAQVWVGIGEDGLTAVAGSVMGNVPAFVGTANAVTAAVDRYPTAGYHYYTWLEGSAAAGTTTWYGDQGQPPLTQSGLLGTIQG